MDWNSNFWAGVSGAIIGAVVGGIISFILQWQSLREARRQRRADAQAADEYRKQEDLRIQRALGASVLFKVIKAEANLDAFQRYFDSAFAKAKEQKIEGQPWAFFQPLSDVPDTIHFTAEEMGMLLGLKNDKVFNATMTLDRDHNHAVAATRLLGLVLRQITSHAAYYREGEDKIVTRYPLEAMPNQLEADSLIYQLRPEVAMLAKAARELLFDLHRLLVERLDVDFGLRITRESGIAAIAQPKKARAS